MVNIFSFMAAVAASDVSSSVASASQMKSANQLNILMLIAVFLIFYFLLIRPQKKKEKENEELRSNIDVGDEIVTIGGMIGTVVSIKDDFIVLETSGDRNKIRITRWAIQSNNTAAERKAIEVDQKKKLKKQ